MSFETFLQFWSIYNRQIIEFVFVATLVLILFVIYRQFFSKSDAVVGAPPPGNAVSIDTSEIEEKLKKIIENQSAYKSTGEIQSKPQVITTTSPISDDPGKTAEIEKTVEKLKTELKEKEKTIEDLKKINTESSTSAVNSGDSGKFEEKIKELEARLQEYEIISEDIADLSFYKEENARLQKELNSLQNGAPAPVLAPPTTTLADKVEPIAEPIAEPPQPAAVTPAAAANNDSVIDDDILKEFAAAVEGQRSAGQDVKKVDPQKLTESKELMGEFENFIKKG